MNQAKKVLHDVWFSLPLQLMVNHVRKNIILLLCWGLLFLMVSGSVGQYLGIPYLFLDPEYLNEISFTSFFIIGFVLGGFTGAFNIASYIMDGYRFSFIGTIKKPFTTFSMNNGILPLSFLSYYIYKILEYQKQNTFSSSNDRLIYVAGLLLGFVLMLFILYAYFWFTNNDILKYVVCKVDEKLKQKVRVTRASAMRKLRVAKAREERVSVFLNYKLHIKRPHNGKEFYDRASVIQVFDQNHFNLVTIEVIIFVLVLFLGWFNDVAFFQIPAAASFILFLTIFLMFAGAFTYWFGRWSVTGAFVLLLLLNTFSANDFFTRKYQAFGLSYDPVTTEYNLNNIKEVINDEVVAEDRKNTLAILENWKKKYKGTGKPKMVFVCTSGGGQRAALWTITALQKVDSLTKSRFWDRTFMVSGASGGAVGAAYYRELVLRKLNNEPINPLSREHLVNISNDNLNPIMFSLLANDLFVGFENYKYGDIVYRKDRGYAFEQQLNKNTKYLLDKPLIDYRQPELDAKVPLLLLAPTIVNDGRKLYISAQSMAYMSIIEENYSNSIRSVNGIDFMRFFEKQNSENLSFLSALRMNATFPYITPNVTLPSNPPIEIMDAGITDNFGITDAMDFIFNFKDWIHENTSGVVLVSIRDSKKFLGIQKNQHRTLLQKFSNPISSIYFNFENFQDIKNDALVEYSKSWFKGSIYQVNLEYDPAFNPENVKRASLNWRLTPREKMSIIENINSEVNKKALERISVLLED